MYQIDVPNNDPNLLATRLSEKELVATSGAYSYGLVTVTKELSSIFPPSVDRNFL